MPDIDIGVDTYQSVASLEDADVYLAADVRYGPLWAALEDDDAKGRILVTVTRLILRQPLKVDLDLSAPPAGIRDAACEFAGALAAGYDLGLDPAAVQVARRQKAGSVEVEYFRNFDAPDYVPPPMPKEAWALLRPFLKTGDGTFQAGAIATGVGPLDYNPLGNGWVGFGSRDYQ